MTDVNFSKQLIKARSAAGFDTAYKFYHRNGGRRHFKFTFVHYNRIEHGLSLPRPEGLQEIFLALRLMPTEAGSRELLVSYLRSLLGGGAAADYILNPLFSGAGNSASSAGPMDWMKAHSSVHLSPDEFSAMASNEAAYWCAEALCNDSGAWKPEELAVKLGLEAKAVKAALENLKKSGLAVKSAGGKYKCRYQGKFFTYPGRLEGMGKALDAVKSYWDKAGAGGRNFFERVELVRAEDGAVSNYRLQLGQAMDAANAYATHSGSDTSGFFLIETRVKKIRKF